MLKPLVTLLIVCLSSCAIDSEQQHNLGLDTWVDEKGGFYSSAKVRQASSISETSILDESHYLPYQAIDKKLTQTRLYSWQENGNQRVYEVGQQVAINEGAVKVEYEYHSMANVNSKFINECCRFIAQYDRYLWSKTNGKKVSLSKYYKYYKEIDSRAMIIELDGESNDTNSARLFVDNNSQVLLPKILFLNAYFEVLHNWVKPFSHYYQETLLSHGYFHGRFRHSILKSARYLLVIPNKEKSLLASNVSATKIAGFGHLMLN